MRIAPADTTSTTAFEEAPYPISADDFTAMTDRGIFSDDRRVFLRDGRLYEKTAKSKVHTAVHGAFNQTISRRLPPGTFLGLEHPVRLDATHLPLPDLVVIRGNPLDFCEDRYPGGRDVLLVVEVAVSSLAGDLGERLDRYARSLPLAVYVVADVVGRRVLVHKGPRAEGCDESCEVVGPGGAISLRVSDVALAPFGYEDVMR